MAVITDFIDRIKQGAYSREQLRILIAEAQVQIEQMDARLAERSEAERHKHVTTMLRGAYR